MIYCYKNLWRLTLVFKNASVLANNKNRGTLFKDFFSRFSSSKLRWSFSDHVDGGCQCPLISWRLFFPSCANLLMFYPMLCWTKMSVIPHAPIRQWLLCPCYRCVKFSWRCVWRRLELCPLLAALGNTKLATASLGLCLRGWFWWRLLIFVWFSAK